MNKWEPISQISAVRTINPITLKYTTDVFIDNMDIPYIKLSESFLENIINQIKEDIMNVMYVNLSKQYLITKDNHDA